MPGPTTLVGQEFSISAFSHGRGTGFSPSFSMISLTSFTIFAPFISVSFLVRGLPPLCLLRMRHFHECLELGFELMAVDAIDAVPAIVSGFVSYFQIGSAFLTGCGIF